MDISRCDTMSAAYMVAISQNNAALGSAHPNTRHASVIQTVYGTTTATTTTAGVVVALLVVVVVVAVVLVMVGDCFPNVGE